MGEPHEIEREKLWRCSCGGSHFVALKTLCWGGEGYTYLIVEDMYRFAGGLRRRLRAAWNVLWRGHHGWTDILLEPDDGRALAAELIALADETEAWLARWREEHGREDLRE